MKGKKTELSRVEYKKDQVFMKAEGNGRILQFSYGSSAEEMVNIGGQQDLSVISFEVAKGFNGPYVGMYASSNGKNARQKPGLTGLSMREKNDTNLPAVEILNQSRFCLP